MADVTSTVSTQAQKIPVHEAAVDVYGGSIGYLARFVYVHNKKKFRIQRASRVLLRTCQREMCHST